MKKILILFLLGAVVGWAGWTFVRPMVSPTMTERAGRLAGETKDTAAEVKEQATDSAREFGTYLGDVGIIALIKSKYALEKELSALAISIHCRDGYVTLSGTAASPELIRRAGEIAGRTKGVTGVSSRLTVKN